MEKVSEHYDQLHTGRSLSILIIFIGGIVYIWLGCWLGLNKVVMELRKTQSRRTTLDDHVITLDNKDEWVLYSHCKNDDVPVCLSFTTFLYRTKLVQLLAANQTYKREGTSIAWVASLRCALLHIPIIILFTPFFLFHPMPYSILNHVVPLYCSLLIQYWRKVSEERVVVSKCPYPVKSTSLSIDELKVWTKL